MHPGPSETARDGVEVPPQVAGAMPVFAEAFQIRALSRCILRLCRRATLDRGDLSEVPPRRRRGCACSQRRPAPTWRSAMRLDVPRSTSRGLKSPSGSLRGGSSPDSGRRAGLVMDDVRVRVRDHHRPVPVWARIAHWFAMVPKAQARFLFHDLRHPPEAGSPSDRRRLSSPTSGRRHDASHVGRGFGDSVRNAGRWVGEGHRA